MSIVFVMVIALAIIVDAAIAIGMLGALYKNRESVGIYATIILANSVNIWCLMNNIARYVR